MTPIQKLTEIEEFAEYLKKEFGQTMAKYNEKKQYNYTCLAVKFADITTAVNRWKTAKKLNKQLL